VEVDVAPLMNLSFDDVTDGLFWKALSEANCTPRGDRDLVTPTDRDYTMFYLYKSDVDGVFYLRNFGASLNCRESWLSYDPSVCGVTVANDLVTLADEPLSVRWHPRSVDQGFPFMRFGMENYFIALDRPESCPNRYAYWNGTEVMVGTQANADQSLFWEAIDF
jgi:hypothetical protein